MRYGSPSLHEFPRGFELAESNSMIDHVSLAVRDLVASAEAYERILAPLGLVRLVERSGAVGFGKRYPELWLNHRPRQTAMPPDTGAHVCLRAPNEEAVRAFHAAAPLVDASDIVARGHHIERVALVSRLSALNATTKRSAAEVIDNPQPDRPIASVAG